MLNKAFDTICAKVEEALKAQGFSRVKAASNDSNEMVALFVSENLAYSVVYYMDQQHMVMRECAMTDDGPDNDWKTLATWMFDPEVDTLKEAASIGNDFVEAVSAPKAIKKAKTTKKTKVKKDDEGNADPVFLAKRFVALFPELKEEIKHEEDCYYPFRSVTFFQASVVPKVQDYIARGADNDLKKLMNLLSAQYNNGDLDTRSIITIVILNSVEEQYDDKMMAFMSDDLKQAFTASRKFRGKTFKPEKPKKPRKTIAQRLQGQ